MTAGQMSIYMENTHTYTEKDYKEGMKFMDKTRKGYLHELGEVKILETRHKQQ